VNENVDNMNIKWQGWMDWGTQESADEGNTVVKQQGY
jgi:hypothetical protein